MQYLCRGLIAIACLYITNESAHYHLSVLQFLVLSVILGIAQPVAAYGWMRKIALAVSSVLVLMLAEKTVGGLRVGPAIYIVCFTSAAEGMWMWIIRRLDRKQTDVCESIRLILVLSVGFFSTITYFTDHQFAGWDARWYASMLQDFLLQWRAGVFPVYVGQGEWAFNGAVHPFRSAPLHMWYAGIIDILSFQDLNAFAIGHLTVAFSHILSGLIVYCCGVRVAPAHRWFVLLIATIYQICPAQLATGYSSEAFMTVMAFPWLAVAVFGNVLCFGERDDEREGWLWIAVGLAFSWMAHPSPASIATIATIFLQLSRFAFTALTREKVLLGFLSGALWISVVCYYFVGMSEVREANPADIREAVFFGAFLLFALFFVGAAHRKHLGLAGIAGCATLLFACLLRPQLAYFFLITIGCYGVGSAFRRYKLIQFGMKREIEWWFGAALLAAFLTPLVFGSDFPGKNPNADLYVVGARTALRNQHLFFAPKGGDPAGSYQFGFAYLILAVVVFVSTWRETNLLARLFLITFVGLLLSWVVPPLVGEFFWGNVPRLITDMTAIAFDRRLFPVLIPILTFAGFISLPTLSARTRTSFAWVLLLLLPWSLWQGSIYVIRGVELRAPRPITAAFFRPENILLTHYAYDLLTIPSYFSHGIMDWRLQSRVLNEDFSVRIGPDEMARAAESHGFEKIAWKGTNSSVPPWLDIAPKFELEPGYLRFLRFEFSRPPPTGILVIRDLVNYREYILPASGLARGFGAAPANDKVLTLGNSSDAYESLGIQLLRGAQYQADDGVGDFATIYSSRVVMDGLPIKTRKLLPYYEAETTVETPGFLETPRCFIPGYSAFVNGQPVAVIKTPEKLVAIPLAAGSNHVELFYKGTIALRISFILTVFGTLLVFSLLCCRFFCPRMFFSGSLFTSEIYLMLLRSFKQQFASETKSWWSLDSLLFSGLIGGFCLYAENELAHLRLNYAPFILVWMGLVLGTLFTGSFGFLRVRYWLRAWTTGAVQFTLLVILIYLGVPITTGNSAYLVIVSGALSLFCLQLFYAHGRSAHSTISDRAEAIVVGCSALWPVWSFLTDRFMGGSDARWYATMCNDFIQQSRAGVFPVFVGQGPYAFNGAIHPFRSAPLHMWACGIIDVLTFRALNVYALEHLTVIVAQIVSAFILYLSLVRIAPQRRWAAVGITALYASCPAQLGAIYASEAYMTFMAFPGIVLALVGNALSFEKENSWRPYLLISAGLGLAWIGHPSPASIATLVTACLQFGRLLFYKVDRRAFTQLGLCVLGLAWLTLFYFVSMAEVSVTRTPDGKLVLIRGICLAVTYVGIACWNANRKVVSVLVSMVGVLTLLLLKENLGVFAGITLVLCLALSGLSRSQNMQSAVNWIMLSSLIASFATPLITGPEFPGKNSMANNALSIAKDNWRQIFSAIPRDGVSNGSFQPGPSLSCLLVFCAAIAFRLRSLSGKLFFWSATLWILAWLIPFYWGDFYWGNMPETITAVTSIAFDRRILPVLVPVMAITLIFFYRDGPNGWLKIAAVLLGCGVVVALWDAGKYVRRGFAITNPRSASEAAMHFENTSLTRYAYDLLQMPPYFSHAGMDWRLESRILDPISYEVLIGPDQIFEAAEQRGSTAVDWVANTNLSYPRWLDISPRLELAPGDDLLLRFQFRSAVPRGHLIFRSNHFYREYIIPSSGNVKAFGTEPENSHVISMQNSNTSYELLDMQILRGGNFQPQDGEGRLATVTFAKMDPDKLPIKVETLIPFYHAKVTLQSRGNLETPRFFIPGYVATLNGQETPALESPNHLVMIALDKGPNDVILKYRGTERLRISFWISFVGWLGVLGALCQVAFKPRTHFCYSTPHID